MRLKLKKLLPIILTTIFLMILNIVPANALAPGKYDCETGVFDNSLSSNYIEIDPFNVAFGNDCVGHANIPQGVEEIDGAAFAFNTSITSVTIPDSVTLLVTAHSRGLRLLLSLFLIQ